MATIEDAALYSALEVAVGFRPTTLASLIASHSSLRHAFESIDTEIAPRTQLEESFDKAFHMISSWGKSVSILGKTDSEYPQNLKALSDAPDFLFIHGDISLISRPGVSVVGSRTASEEGRLRAYRLAKLLVDNNFVVFSGLAAGIDTAAHLGALKAKGSTVAVIGTPIHKAYPKENTDLQDLISINGAVVSQFSPLRPTQRLNFPLRNSLMSGLSQATVIVEASETSGALIQARHCLKQGRTLFIMKNQIERTDLSWPREYLKKGARTLSDVSELIDGLPKARSDEQLRLL